MEGNEKDKIVKLSLTVLVDDEICVEELLGAHGLSLFLTLVNDPGEEHHILFDVGPSSELLKVNSDILGLDLKLTDYVFISSSISHHLYALFERSSHLMKEIRDDVLLNSIKDFHQNISNIDINGAYLKIANLGGLWNERALLIPHVKGWVVLIGCSAHGLEWSLKSLERSIPRDNVYGLIGGLGLSKLDVFSFKTLGEFVRKRNVRLLVPLHSTARDAKEELLREFSDITPECTGVGQSITI